MIQRQRSLIRSRSLATVGFLSPGLGLLIIFVAVPILLTAWISLHQGSMAIPYSRMRWVGLKNYVTVFEQADLSHGPASMSFSIRWPIS